MLNPVESSLLISLDAGRDGVCRDSLREEPRVLATVVESNREERPHRPDCRLQTPPDVQVSVGLNSKF